MIHFAPAVLPPGLLWWSPGGKALTRQLCWRGQLLVARRSSFTFSHCEDLKWVGELYPEDVGRFYICSFPIR